MMVLMFHNSITVVTGYNDLARLTTFFHTGIITYRQQSVLCVIYTIYTG